MHCKIKDPKIHVDINHFKQISRGSHNFETHPYNSSCLDKVYVYRIHMYHEEASTYIGFSLRRELQWLHLDFPPQRKLQSFAKPSPHLRENAWKAMPEVALIGRSWETFCSLALSSQNRLPRFFLLKHRMDVETILRMGYHWSTLAVGLASKESKNLFFEGNQSSSYPRLQWKWRSQVP